MTRWLVNAFLMLSLDLLFAALVAGAIIWIGRGVL